jgi:cell division protein FtsW (lipid II flippase)
VSVRYLPDSHTDFVFAIDLEDPGIIILCLALLALSAFFVIRRLRRP